jgi:hypothetical protein
MARRTARPQPSQTLDLPALTHTCPECGGPLWAAYKAQRSVTTLDGTVRLRLQVRRCRVIHCSRCRVGGGASKRWPPSAAQTGRAVFPHPAFTKARQRRRFKEGIR